MRRCASGAQSRRRTPRTSTSPRAAAGTRRAGGPAAPTARPWRSARQARPEDRRRHGVAPLRPRCAADLLRLLWPQGGGIREGAGVGPAVRGLQAQLAGVGQLVGGLTGQGDGVSGIGALCAPVQTSGSPARSLQPKLGPSHQRGRGWPAPVPGRPAGACAELRACTVACCACSSIKGLRLQSWGAWLRPSAASCLPCSCTRSAEQLAWLPMGSLGA